jgi:anaerobic magnesium-protoporphyrin IX monomethyl ester cyclase
MERFSPAIPPLGVVWPATVLAGRGHEVRVLDQHGLRWSQQRTLEAIVQWRPQLLGISCLSFCMDAVEALVPALRSRLPGLTVVLGNLHATLFHEDLVASGVADVVLRGEGELSLAALADALASGRSPRGIAGATWRDGVEVVVEPDPEPLELGRLPVPDWRLVRGVRYEAFRVRDFDVGPLCAAVQASRGCAFRCSFCSQNLMHRGVRMRPVEHVLDELEALLRQGITRVGMVDANFPPDKRYGMAFARGLRARGLHRQLRWFTEVRIDLVDEELVSALASAGMGLVQFGVESGDDGVLEGVGKTAGWEDAAARVRGCRERGVLTVGLFVIGFPGETEAQIRKTIRAAIELDPDLVKFSVATPYPGTALWEAHREELVAAPWSRYSGWLDPGRAGPHLLERHTLPSARLAALQREAMLRFYARPAKLARLFGAGVLRPTVLLDGARSQVEIGLATLLERLRPGLWGG